MGADPLARVVEAIPAGAYAVGVAARDGRAVGAADGDENGPAGAVRAAAAAAGV